MLDQYLALSIIGVIILVLGLALLIGKRKGGYVVTLLGALWLLTMVIYYAFDYAGLYETKSRLYPVANVIGVLLIVIGLGAVLYYWARAGVLREVGK